jgi:aconitate hydratase
VAQEDERDELLLQFLPGESAAPYDLDGTEVFSITGLAPLNLGETVPLVNVTRENDDVDDLKVRLRNDTPTEAEYYRHGGVLNFVLRQLASS